MSWGSGAWGGGEGWTDDNASISNASPADLSDLTRMEPIEFDVSDLATINIRMRYDGDTDWMTVYDHADNTADGFLGTFARESERTAIAYGFHFSILPAGGWRKPFAIIIRSFEDL